MVPITEMSRTFILKGKNETAETGSSAPLTFDPSHRAQVLLEAVVELGIGDGLKVAGVDAAGRRGVAARAHAGVVAQPALVQVRVGQGVLRRDPLGLETQEELLYHRLATRGLLWLYRSLCFMC